jgi:hypothetical protein
VLFTSLQGDNKDKFALDGISKPSEANAQYGASSSGSHKDLYPDTAVPGTVFLFLIDHFENCGDYT